LPLAATKLYALKMAARKLYVLKMASTILYALKMASTKLYVLTATTATKRCILTEGTTQMYVSVEVAAKTKPNMTPFLILIKTCYGPGAIFIALHFLCYLPMVPIS
jgi:hypothetical protein